MTRTSQHEAARYTAVSAQVTQLLDDMANDRSPQAHVTAIGRAWLAAELFWQNEQAHQGHEARTDLVVALQHRIQALEAQSI